MTGLSGCAGVVLDAAQPAQESSAAGGQPSAAALKQPGPLGDKTLGSPDAPVTLIEYASLTCPHSRAFHQNTFPQLKKHYIDTGKVYFILREFPIGQAAAAAALAVRCAPEKDYFRLNEKFLAAQSQWVALEVKRDAIHKIVQETGLSRAAFDSCLANQKTTEGLIWVKQRGRELGVKATPFFFVNGQKASGALSFDEMRKLIERETAQSKESSAPIRVGALSRVPKSGLPGFGIKLCENKGL